MTLVSHVFFAAAAVSVVVAAARITLTMSKTRSVVGPAAVVTLVASWALCVWLPRRRTCENPDPQEDCALVRGA